MSTKKLWGLFFVCGFLYKIEAMDKSFKDDLFFCDDFDCEYGHFEKEDGENYWDEGNGPSKHLFVLDFQKKRPEREWRAIMERLEVGIVPENKDVFSCIECMTEREKSFCIISFLKKAIETKMFNKLGPYEGDEIVEISLGEYLFLKLSQIDQIDLWKNVIFANKNNALPFGWGRHGRGRYLFIDSLCGYMQQNMAINFFENKDIQDLEFDEDTFEFLLFESLPMRQRARLWPSIERRMYKESNIKDLATFNKRAEMAQFD